MRILHTSDWHIGRTFHKTSTLEPLQSVFEAMVGLVEAHKVDVVLASGDIFDTSTPSADAVKMLDSVLLQIAGAGARVVMTSGNHDSPARLGAKAVFAHKSGIHVLTDSNSVADPISIPDEHGDVHFYGIPFIEPGMQRAVWADAESMRSQKDALGYVMGKINGKIKQNRNRSVVLAHTFVAGAEGESCDSERDIVGGVDKVPVSYFSEFTYAALGHIHGRSTLAENIRYSGAPLHYSFSEANKPRGGWLVELDANGLSSVEWLDFPIPRPLSGIKGKLDDLLIDSAHADKESHWISAVITDTLQPKNAFNRLRDRFPHLVELRFEPEHVHEQKTATYAQLIKGKTDLEIIDTFLESVRNGEKATEPELVLLRKITATKGDK